MTSADVHDLVARKWHADAKKLIPQMQEWELAGKPFSDALAEGKGPFLIALSHRPAEHP